MRGRRYARAAVAALLVDTAFVGAAFAEAPAPRFVNVDANGVDLTTGKVQFSFEEGGIGSGEGAVRFQRIFAQDAGFVDNYSGGMFEATVNGVTRTYVQVAGISDVFTKSGSTYTSDNASGSTLIYDSGSFSYIYTAADGTRINFSGDDYYGVNFACPGAEPQTCHVPLTIARPNGLKLRFTWETGVLCHDMPGEPCYTEQDYKRLTAISTSAGYSAAIAYASNSIGTAWPNPNPDWFKRTSVTFGNSVNPPSPAPAIGYGYPSSGVVTVTDPGSRQWRLTTDASGRITGIRRPGSASDNISYAYGADGTISSATKDGVTTTYARVVSLNTATETTTDSLGNHTVTVSDLTKGRPTSFKDELNRTTAYEYDANGRLTKVTQPEGNAVQLAYDARGNVTTTTRVAKSGSGLANIVTSVSFDATCTNVVKCNQPNTTADAKGNVTDYTYDSTHGGVLTVTRPPPAAGLTRPETRYSYTSIASASGDAVYELTGVSACPNGSGCTGTSDETKAIIAYNSNLLPTSITRRDGTGGLSSTTAASYDARGRVSTIDGSLSGTSDTTKYRWDGSDQLVGVTDPDPDGAGALKMRAVRLTYRSDGQVSRQELGTVVDQSDPAWANFVTAQTVDIGFDGNSRPVTSKLSAGGTDYALTQTSYDALGRTDCTAIRMNTGVYGSLPAACALSTQGINGPDRISQIVYDAASQPIQLKVAVGTADAATERSLVYTSNGMLASLTDGENNKTSYVYDGFDRLSQTQYPNATKGLGTSNTSDFEQLTYDANSNVTQYRARSGGTIAFAYDNLDRITSKTSASLPAVNYTYDLLDRPLTAKFASNGQGITNAYDALSRTTSSSSDVGGTAHALSYLYDLAGRRTRISWWDGFKADYTRLVTGEISQLSDISAAGVTTTIATFGYDDLRRRTSLTRPNSTSTAYGYDAVSRLTSIAHDMPNNAYDLTLTEGYNPAFQIVTETRSNDAFSFTANANASIAYVSNGLNQGKQADATVYGFDANGNLTSDGWFTFTYDIENKLVSALPINAGVRTLNYDPLNRLDTYNPGTAKRFIYDGDEVVAELDASGNIMARYVRGDAPDEIVTGYTSSSPTARGWYHLDQRNSVIAVTDPNGTVTVLNRYDEYGQPQGGNYGTFQYTGQMWLGEIGVYNYKNRMYWPNERPGGRFMQADPIGPVDSVNLYQYALNDPLNLTDPLGLQACGGELGECVVHPGDIVVPGRRPFQVNVQATLDLLSRLSSFNVNFGALFGRGSQGGRQQSPASQRQREQTRKISPCMQKFLASKSLGGPNLGSVVFHNGDGGSLIAKAAFAHGNPAITIQNSVYVAPGHWNSFREGTSGFFEETIHSMQWEVSGAGNFVFAWALGSVAGAAFTGDPHNSPLEAQAMGMSVDLAKAYSQAGGQCGR